MQDNDTSKICCINYQICFAIISYVVVTMFELLLENFKL